jgi:hypothetical protein
MRKTILLLTAVALIAPLLAAEEPEKKAADEVAREIVLKKPVGGFRFTNGIGVKITSAEDLIQELPGQAAIAKQVDFTKEYLVMFTWRGSGGDRKSFKVEEGKDGPVVVFTTSAGQSADLKPHVRLYAISKKATWRGDKN